MYLLNALELLSQAPQSPFETSDALQAHSPFFKRIHPLKLSLSSESNPDPGEFQASSSDTLYNTICSISIIIV
jgi:hypothetical protein